MVLAIVVATKETGRGQNIILTPFIKGWLWKGSRACWYFPKAIRVAALSASKGLMSSMNDISIEKVDEGRTRMGDRQWRAWY